jgi:predicted lipoprotein with Yx(FWY)xxD motif
MHEPETSPPVKRCATTYTRLRAINRSGRPRLRRAVSISAMVMLAAAGPVAYAFAAQTSIAVHQARNPGLGERIVIDPHAHTLYALAPERAHHLLCKSKACFKLWPPLTVRSRKVRLEAGPGVHGRLTILRRRNGMLQVMLRGMPLYRFAGDHGRGQANGQGIASFGGRWHAVTAIAGSGKAPRRSHRGSSAPGGSAPGGPEGAGQPRGGYEGSSTSGTATTTYGSTATATGTMTTSTTVTTSSTTYSYGPGG